jgi:hypothetical protein
MVQDAAIFHPHILRYNFLISLRFSPRETEDKLMDRKNYPHNTLLECRSTRCPPSEMRFLSSMDVST